MASPLVWACPTCGRAQLATGSPAPGDVAPCLCGATAVASTATLCVCAFRTLQPLLAVTEQMALRIYDHMQGRVVVVDRVTLLPVDLFEVAMRH